MIVVLSPAKKLNEGPAIAELPRSRPALIDDAAELASISSELTADELADHMGLSAKLASLNAERFQAWDPDPSPQRGRQAVRMFAGDTYRGLDAERLTPDDLRWAQSHVGILSGLYGVLRPLDLICAYRLEMGTRLTNPRGSDLYAFWGERIARTLSSWLEEHEHKVVINCASQEYFRAIDLEALGARVITPVFQEVSEGQAKVISFYAKEARGRMARFVIEHRCERPEQVLAFAEAGYRYVPEASQEDTPVFRRPKPPPKSR